MSYSNKEFAENNNDVKIVLDIIRQTFNENFIVFNKLLKDSYEHKINKSSIHDATRIFSSGLRDKINKETFNEVSSSIRALEQTIINAVDNIEDDRKNYDISTNLCTYEYRMLSTLFVNLLYNLYSTTSNSFKLLCDNLSTLRREMCEQKLKIEKSFFSLPSSFIDRQKRKLEELFKHEIDENFKTFSETQTYFEGIKQSIENGDVPFGMNGEN